MVDVTSAQRMAILERLERGEITAAQAMALLEALPDKPWPIAHEAAHNGRDRLLDMIDHGEITAGEALQRLGVDAAQNANRSTGPAGSAVGSSDPIGDVMPEAVTLSATANATATDGAAAARASRDMPPAPPEIESWRHWYQIPLAIGIAVIVLGSLLMYSALQASGMGFWFVCASVPVTLGVLLAVLAWLSRNGPWLHMRVHTGRGTWPNTIAISLPLPVHVTAWALHTFAPKDLPLQDMSMDELIQGLSSASPATPFYVDVADGANGERVQVFIG